MPPPKLGFDERSMIQCARRLLISFGLAAFMAMGALATTAQAEVPYQQLIPKNSKKYAAIVMGARSGEVLYVNRADSPRYPASITKVMTLYLTFEALAWGRIGMDDKVVFSPRAAAQPPTKLGVRAGSSITVSEAIQALAIKSANDVAVAMAEKLGGTEQRFATLMTLRALELGMTNTHFANASGLPDSRQLTTARDIATLSRAVMRDYPQYYSLFSQTQFTFRGLTMRNHNDLLFSMPGVDGLKTGFTNASGYNLAVSAVRDGRRLITVVLGGPSTTIRDKNAEGLLLTGFDVIERRAHGEPIAIAQNFFEAPGPSDGTTTSTAQGDEDLKIVLASAAPTLRAADVEIVESKGKWIVQVGAFRKRSSAREQLRIVERRFGAHFNKAEGETDRAAGRYRARFSGFSETDAKAACQALKAKRQPCLVVAPRG